MERIVQISSDQGDRLYAYQTGEGKLFPLNSVYSPLKEAEKYIKKNVLENDGSKKKGYILIGIGNGAFVKKWIEIVKDFVHLYIIEPYSEIPTEDVFQILHPLPSNITFEYYDPSKLPLKFASFLQQHLGVDFQILIHPHYEKTDLVLIKEIINVLNQGIKISRLSLNTENLFRKEWIIEPLLNLRYIPSLTNIKELKDLFKGERAVLVASGPSLKEHIEDIRKMQKGAYVFAAGSSTRGLLRFGIKPDFVVTYDSGKVNYETHFKDLAYDGPLICGSMVNADILAHHSGPVIYLMNSTDYVTQRFIKDVPLFDEVPSVANLTLVLIYYLGFKEVYLVGQDLALINGDYYAEGIHHHHGSVSQKGTMMVEDNNGTMVQTNEMLFTFLQTFNNIMSQLKNADFKAYNLSKYGAKIDGVPYIASEELPSFPMRKELKLSIKPKEVSKEGINSIKKFMSDLDELYHFLSYVNKKLSYIDLQKVNLSDMRKVTRLFKQLREHTLFEEVIIQRFSFQLTKSLNLFKYSLEKDEYTNDDYMTMICEIKQLVSLSQKLIEEIMEDERISAMRKEYFRE